MDEACTIVTAMVGKPKRFDNLIVQAVALQEKLRAEGKSKTKVKPEPVERSVPRVEMDPSSPVGEDADADN
jgi:hypothetical protein